MKEILLRTIMANVNVVKIAGNMLNEYQRTQSLQGIIDHPDIAYLVRNPHLFSRMIRIVCDNLPAQNLFTFVDQAKNISHPQIKSEIVKQTVECVATRHWNNSDLLSTTIKTLFPETIKDRFTDERHCQIFSAWARSSATRHLIGEQWNNLSTYERYYVEVHIVKQLHQSEDLVNLLQCVPYFNNTALIFSHLQSRGPSSVLHQIVRHWEQLSSDKRIEQFVNGYILSLPQGFQDKYMHTLNLHTHKALSKSLNISANPVRTQRKM